jgi:large subunit ribosomal protein L7Ae
VASKAELGNACGLSKPTASVAVVEAGKAKPLIDSLAEQVKKLKK